MPIYRPSELRQFLEGVQTGPKKHLSQNFLTDGNILRKIASAAKIEKGDLVLEIGPGPGALTEVLLQAGAKVIAVEKDPILAAALSRLSSIGDLTVINADIMEVRLEDIMTSKGKVAANLPYHLTSPILGLVAPRHDLFSTVHVMVQEEVARRMTAKPGSKDYSSLTVFLEFYSRAQYAFFVGRKCFFPAPKVDSAVVSLELHAPPADIDPYKFFELVHAAFGQRRKMIRASLKSQIPNIQSFTQIGIDPSARPETLSLEQWLILCKAFNSNA